MEIIEVKDIKMKKQYYAMSSMFVSPEPSTIPIPVFDEDKQLNKDVVDKKKTKILLTLLGKSKVTPAK